MMKNIPQKPRQKGFTLVEMVVVLAIMAILMTMLIPSLTGYVDRARNQSVLAETRSVVLAAQTILSEDYSAGKPITEDSYLDETLYERIKALAEVDGTISGLTLQTEGGGAADPPVGKLLGLTYTNGGITCTYNAQAADDPYAISSGGASQP